MKGESSTFEGVDGVMDVLAIAVAAIVEADEYFGGAASPVWSRRCDVDWRRYGSEVYVEVSVTMTALVCPSRRPWRYNDGGEAA